MKRAAIWAFYAVGALAIGYLALYAYAVSTGRDLQPGDPIPHFPQAGCAGIFISDHAVAATRP